MSQEELKSQLLRLGEAGRNLAQLRSELEKLPQRIASAERDYNDATTNIIGEMMKAGRHTIVIEITSPIAAYDIYHVVNQRLVVERVPK